MRVVYYADDGTEFESEKECMEYEKKTADILAEFTNNIHAYDNSGDTIDLNDYDTDDWESAFQEIEHIQFDTQKAIDYFIEYAIGQFGLCDIASDIHREVRPGEKYFYDWGADEWACLDDRQRELDMIARVFKAN